MPAQSSEPVTRAHVGPLLKPNGLELPVKRIWYSPITDLL